MSPHAQSSASVASRACSAAIERIAATVGIALGLARSGRPVDLSGLDMEAGRVCAQVLDLPPGEGALLREGLSGLATKMAALEAVLKTP